MGTDSMGRGTMTTLPVWVLGRATSVVYWRVGRAHNDHTSSMGIRARWQRGNMGVWQWGDAPARASGGVDA